MEKNLRNIKEEVWPDTSDPTIVPLSSIKYFHIKWNHIQPVQKNDYMEINLVDYCQVIL